MSFLLAIYIVLIIINGTFLNKKENWIVLLLSMAYMLYLCYSGDFSRSYDINNYNYMYDSSFLNQDEDFSLYYLFYIFMMAGQLLKLSFADWWLSMNILSFVVLISAFRVHRINPHYFMFFFMAYFFLNFYSGFKYYYGFCCYFLAFGYLFKPGLKNSFLYVIFTLIAGGIHMMYYFFLPFALLKFFEKILFERGWIIKSFVLFSVLFSIFLKATGSAKGFFANINTESDRVQGYLELETNFGFFIPVFFHILSIFQAYKMHNYSMSNDDEQSYRILLPLWQNTLCQVAFYPLYMLALTFARLTTVSSIVLLSYQGLYYLYFDKKQKTVLFCISIIILIAYYYRQFVMGSLWDVNVVPLFKLN